MASRPARNGRPAGTEDAADTGEGACRNCGAVVPATARRCRFCGYETARHNKYRFLWGVPGTLLTLSVVGAPLGLPMVWKAYRHRRRLDGTVVAPAADSPADRPRAADGSGE